MLGSRTVVGMGMLLALVTGIGAGRNLWISFSGTTAEGIVVRQIEELAADWPGASAGAGGDGRGGVETAAAQRVFRAVVAFQDGSRSYEVTASARAIVHLYPLGSKVDVVYPRGRPERARLRPELPDFWIQAGVLLVSTLLGAGSGYLWWKLAIRRLARRRVGQSHLISSRR